MLNMVKMRWEVCSRPKVGVANICACAFLNSKQRSMHFLVFVSWGHHYPCRWLLARALFAFIASRMILRQKSKQSIYTVLKNQPPCFLHQPVIVRQYSNEPYVDSCTRATSLKGEAQLQHPAHWAQGGSLVLFVPLHGYWQRW